MKLAPLALAAALLTAPPARADMGPLLPATKHANVTTTRIEVADALPDHIGVFVRSYGLPKFADEYEFVPLAPGTTLEFAGRYHDRAELLIVPKADAGAYPNAKALADAVVVGKVRAVGRTFYSRETLPSWGPGDVTLSYSVRAGAGTPEIVRTSRSPLWQWYVAASAFALAMVLGGLWCVRFLFRLRPTHRPNPNEAGPRLVG
ncbi:hypothetical protein R5W23_004049 [Gemmata sp. JC673]|uniref:Uncharacterized protein n=1 Tax=Gemmata algarum TaxID=2975278 RepID=A0ABU5F645_9BACT|nr:hypothetical protein [Gemmata algarum]MDY3562583.1 hypothetical protein [Gemmata algarum]